MKSKDRFCKIITIDTAGKIKNNHLKLSFFSISFVIQYIATIAIGSLIKKPSIRCSSKLINITLLVRSLRYVKQQIDSATLINKGNIFFRDKIIRAENGIHATNTAVNRHTTLISRLSGNSFT